MQHLNHTGSRIDLQKLPNF